MALELAEHHRQEQASLAARVLQAVIPLWSLLDGSRLDATFVPWSSAVAQLITRHRGTSASLAASYLRDARHEARIPGDPIVIRAAPLDPPQLATSLRVTSTVAVKRSMLAGKSLDAAMNDAFVQSSGATTRHVLNAGRETVTASVQADPAIAGYERVVRPDSTCKFCLMLAGRGAVYKSTQTAGQGQPFHDHCHCAIAAVYA
jgi:hypothetical protein